MLRYYRPSDYLTWAGFTIGVPLVFSGMSIPHPTRDDDIDNSAHLENSTDVWNSPHRRQVLACDYRIRLHFRLSRLLPRQLQYRPPLPLCQTGDIDNRTFLGLDRKCKRSENGYGRNGRKTTCWGTPLWKITNGSLSSRSLRLTIPLCTTQIPYSSPSPKPGTVIDGV